MGQGKIRVFCVWSGKCGIDLESHRKVGGNSSFQNFFCSKVKDVLCNEIVQAHLPPHIGLHFMEEFDRWRD